MKELPVRPRPAEFEPLLGYMYRLSIANGYPNMKEMWSLIAGGSDQHEEIMLAALKLETLPVFGAPAPRWLKLNVNYRDVAAVNYNRYDLRYCQQCLLEAADIKAFWALNLAVACAKHKCWLTSLQGRIKSKGSDEVASFKLSTTTLSLSQLLQKSLERCKPVRLASLPAIPNALSTVQIIKLLKALASVGNDLPGKRRSPAKLYLFENAKEHFTKAASMLEEWPTAFWKMLDQKMMSSPASISIKEVFGEICDKLYVELRDTEFSFLREAFEGYLADSWRGEISGRHRRFNRKLIEAQHRISITKAERELGISDRTLKRMVRDGDFSTAETISSGKREFTTLEFSEVCSVLRKNSQLLSLKSASQLVGLAPERMRSLITAGYLPAVAQPFASTENRWKVERNALKKFVEKFESKVKISEDSSLDVSLSHALRFWRLNSEEWCALAQAMIAGAIFFQCDGEFSFSKVRFRKQDLRGWLTEYEAKPIQLNVATAALLMHLKEEVIYQLIAHGFIPTRVEVRRGHLLRGIALRDIREFEEKYVSLAEMAQEHETSPAYLKRILTTKPQTGPEIDGCRQYFYLRDALITERERLFRKACGEMEEKLKGQSYEWEMAVTKERLKKMEQYLIKLMSNKARPDEL
jgi:AraC-like DNA-binding protein